MRKKSRKQLLCSKIPFWLVVCTTLVCFVSMGLCVSAQESSSVEEKVMVGGDVFGTRISTKGVLVVGITSVVSNGQERSPARDAGICSKDIINLVNGKEIEDKDSLISEIEKSEGKPLEISLTREGENISVILTPVLSDSDGVYRGGLWVRDSLAGIGTVTFLDPKTGAFAGLGHGICDPDTGVLMPVRKGSVYRVKLGDIKKGSAGAPGELRGILDDKKIGIITDNTKSGVSGIFSDTEKSSPFLQIARHSEVKIGKVTIISTVNADGPCEYSAEIEKICDADGRVKNFIIRITDKRLLDLTGGIVQGMSGSPIIQNGKLIGAITHVLIDDPTRGYGIFAENMMANMAKSSEK
ncbi:MAG: SpoIVB peptidase [Clostridia bacterium]|nr:SpoIVB peptidase [Clostridia bacterium]